jgi:hypothetical protein
MVHVSPMSPAQAAGMASEDWVVSIDGETMDLWERRGAVVGASIRIVAYRYPVGHFAADVVLIAPPVRTKPPRKVRLPVKTLPEKIAPGLPVAPEERLQWVDKLSGDGGLTGTAVRLATYLMTTRRNARSNVAYPGRQRIASDHRISVRTVDRVTALLRRRGWFMVMSGSLDGTTNRYLGTWPETFTDYVLELRKRRHNRATTPGQRHG